MMKKAITGLAAAALLAGAVTMPSQAEARWGHRGWGWGPGIFGGLAAGALIGSALAGPRYYGPYYGYRSYYGPAYAYYGPRPYYRYGPGYAYVGGPYAYRDCVRRRVWTPYGWRWRRACY
jgi:hypothetical protein